jgi:hypothetical protein
MPVHSKNKLLIIIASSLLALGIIAGTVYSVIQFNKAQQASKTYLTKTVEHLKAIGSAPDDKPKERIDIFRDKVALEDVTLGSVLSPDYRKAELAEKEYTAVIDTAMPFFEQNYTLAALTPELLEFIAIVKESAPAGADAATQATFVESRAKKLDAVATTIDGLYFDDAHKSLKTTAVDEIRKMSTASKDTSDLLRKGNTSQSLRTTLQLEYRKSYENASDAIREMPAYGQEILEYLKANKDPLDSDFQKYIEVYKA